MAQGDHHAVGGEWRIEHPRVRWDLLDAFRMAAEQAGIKRIDDFNTGDNEGSCAYHVNQKRGRRWSAARGFLKPVLNRQNLRLETECLVEAVTFDGKRANGVRFRQNGETKLARCRGEVIMAAGSIGSIQILQLSGVGPAAHLKEHGIPIVLDKPGVGENLQDHLQLRMIYKVTGAVTLNETYASLPGRAKIFLDYALFRKGPLTMAPSQLGIFTRSDAKRERANIQYHVQPLSLDRFGEPLHTFPAFTASVANVQPTSRGFVRLKSADPADKPAIQPNYLSTDEDRRVAANSIRVTRNIVRQQALAPFKPVEYLPGTVADDDEAGLDQSSGRDRHHDLPSGWHRQDGIAQRSDGGGGRTAAHLRPARHPRGRRVGDADHHIRQHQLADHHDRREGRDDDPRGRAMNLTERVKAITAQAAGRVARDRRRARRSEDALTATISACSR